MWLKLEDVNYINTFSGVCAIGFVLSLLARTTLGAGLDGLVTKMEAVKVETGRAGSEEKSQEAVLILGVFCRFCRPLREGLRFVQRFHNLFDEPSF